MCMILFFLVMFTSFAMLFLDMWVGVVFSLEKCDSLGLSISKVSTPLNTKYKWVMCSIAWGLFFSKFLSKRYFLVQILFCINPLYAKSFSFLNRKEENKTIDTDNDGFNFSPIDVIDNEKINFSCHVIYWCRGLVKLPNGRVCFCRFKVFLQCLYGC